VVLGLAAVGSASPSRGVRYETPNSHVQISWNGQNNGDDGSWGQTSRISGTWHSAGSYGGSRKYGAAGGAGGDDGSSSSEEGDGGSGGKYGGRGGSGGSRYRGGKGGDMNDGDMNDGDNNAEISVKTSTDKDGKVQKEIDIELTLDGNLSYQTIPENHSCRLLQ
jgi:hypothetical protein